MNNERTKGFTLVEVLVVVVVIGILALIAVPLYLNQKGAAHDASAKSAVRNTLSLLATTKTDNANDWRGYEDNEELADALKDNKPDGAKQGFVNFIAGYTPASANDHEVNIIFLNTRKTKVAAVSRSYNHKYYCGIISKENKMMLASTRTTSNSMDDFNRCLQLIEDDEDDNNSNPLTSPQTNVEFDLVEPEPPVLTGPSEIINTPQVEIIIAAGEPGGTIECKVDNESYQEVNGNFTPVLDEGDHIIKCRHIDKAGNISEPGETTVSVDLTSPSPPVITASSLNTSNPDVTITVTPSETGGGVECQVNNSGTFPVETLTFNYNLSEGNNNIICTQTDAAGNTSPSETIIINVDTTPPGEPQITSPGSLTNDNTPTFTITPAEPSGTIECRKDSGEYTNVNENYSPTLTDGEHTIYCRQVDDLGNVGASSEVVIIVDTSAPASPVVSAPASLTNDNTPTFTITPAEPGGTLRCKMDDGEYIIVSNNTFTPATLSDSSHVAYCTQTDDAGNTSSPGSDGIIIDTTPPNAPSISTSANPTNDNTPTFTITPAESGGIIRCKMDNNSYQISSTSYTSSSLSDGLHIIYCTQTDDAENTSSPGQTSITIDTTGPTLTIEDGTPRWDGMHDFTINSNEATSNIQCKIDSGSYQAVSTSFTTSVLSNGTHSISCFGADNLGNVGAVTTQSFGVFKDPVTVSKSGGFQWGLACTGSTTLNSLLGCPDDSLVINIPAYPNGITGTYIAYLTADITNLCNMAGLGSTYTMYILVDGVNVVSDSDTAGIDLFCLNRKTLTITNYVANLSANQSHTIQLSLKSSAILSILPNVQSSSLTVSMYH